MELPPVHVTRAVIQRYARMLLRYRDDFGARPLVLPNREFFPDHFDGEQESVVLLASRMLEHAGLDDVPVDVRVVGADAAPASSSCGTGSCGVPQAAQSGEARLVDQGDGWLLQVPSNEVRHSVALSTNLARSLSFLFLVETQREQEVIEPPVDVTADFVAVGLGLGALMLQGSYIYAKSCGGPQVASVTKVATPELAVATALFAALGGHELGPALKALDVTQRAALNEARALMRGNKKLIEKLQANPEAVARGEFELAEPKTAFGALFGKLFKSAERPLDLSGGLPSDVPEGMELDELEQLVMDMPPSSSISRRPEPPQEAERDEIKDLVSEALNQARA